MLIKSIWRISASIALVITTLISCEKLAPPLPNDDELLDGPVEGLTYAQNSQFLKGDVAFNDVIFTSETGLGSLFVATSCGSCHAGDGKGHPFTTLIRFGQTDSTGNQYLDQGGPQLQNRALPGFAPEQIPAGATYSRFTPPANTGLGFIELVSDADIIAMADPDDADGDGISGVPNWKVVPSYIVHHPDPISQGGKYICRFGKKAGAYNLLHQTVNAYNQDIGITSVFEPKDVYSGLDIDPEVSTQTINDVVFYLQTLKAPIQRNQEDAEVINGESIFIQTGCESCHKQTLKTGYSPVDALSYKEFHPYSDLLLHDMGSGLDDGYTEGSAHTYEWRTPPLWGLGLSPNSQGGAYYLMHDGRAASIEDAILLHGGEAENSKNLFQNLSQADRDALIEFLKIIVMERKEFIKACGVICMGGVTAFLPGCASTNYFAQTSFANNQIAVKKSEFVGTVKGKQLLRKYVLVKTDQLNFPICLYKINDENYSAVLMECTHKGCELQPGGNYLICPCHGSEFTNQGIVQNPPAEENLRTFKITTDNEHIYIQL